jgi:hypothetical protein
VAVVYSIRDWNRHFEVSQSRKAGRHKWVAVPTKHDGKSFRRIMRRPDAGDIFTAWMLLVQIAAKCEPRGVLADDDGPLDAECFSDKTGFSVSKFDEALKVLSSQEIGWLLVAQWEHAGSTLPLHNRTVQDSTRQDITCGETGIPSTPPVPNDEPAVLTFPCDGKPNAWLLTESQLANWRSLFPSLDLLAECRTALAWVLADTTRRKTARGMPKFLVGWFGRAQNGRRGQVASGTVVRERDLPPTPRKIAEDRFYAAQKVIDRCRRERKSEAEINAALVAAGFDPKEAYAQAPTP